VSYDLKKLREAMDEQLPPVNLNKERILDAVREMRPVRKGRITRLVTLIAACIVLVFALGSLSAEHDGYAACHSRPYSSAK